ncbi:MAG: hypothetical protein ACW99A_18010 [Candidatus Kariarchaeaceae archaeon]|jgi:hypothetical protein
MSNFCTQCGADLGFEDDFCGDCGTRKSMTATHPMKIKPAKSEYVHSQYPRRHDTEEIRFISFRKKLLAPIIFDRQTIQAIGDDKSGTFTALVLFTVNYYYMIFSLLFGSDDFRYWDGLEYLFFLLIIGYFLIFLIFSLVIISWSYIVVLRIIGENHSISEIFRLACYSSSWITIGSTLALLSRDIEFDILLIIIFPYIWLAGFIIAVSIYTERNFIVILLLGTIVAVMTWILGAILGFIMIIIFIGVWEAFFGSFW